jgi:hypothetical protein
VIHAAIHLRGYRTALLRHITRIKAHKGAKKAASAKGGRDLCCHRLISTLVPRGVNPTRARPSILPANHLSRTPLCRCSCRRIPAARGSRHGPIAIVCRHCVPDTRHGRRVTRVAAPFNDPHVAKKCWNGRRRQTPRRPSGTPTCPVRSAPRPLTAFGHTQKHLRHAPSCRCSCLWIPAARGSHHGPIAVVCRHTANRGPLRDLEIHEVKIVVVIKPTARSGNSRSANRGRDQSPLRDLGNRAVRFVVVIKAHCEIWEFAKCKSWS